MPAVEAATEYCPAAVPGEGAWSPSPFPLLEGKRASERLTAERWSVLPWHRRRRRPGGSGEYQEGAFVWLPLWRLLSAGGRSCGQDGKSPPPLSFPRTQDCAVPETRDADGEVWSPPRCGRVSGGMEAGFASSSYCALGITAPRASPAASPLRRACAPTGLIPLPPLAAFIRPAPGPVLAVSRPLLFEFRFRTEGAFVDVLRSSPRRPLLAGETFGEVGGELSPSCLAC